MFATLQFVIVLVSMAVKVLTITLGPQFITCPLGDRYKFVDNKTLDQYEVYGGQALVDIININIRGDFKRGAVYAYINSTTIAVQSHVKQVQYSAHTAYSKQNWEFLWKYKGHAGATAQIVRNGLHGYYEVGDGDCEVTTFTIDERWLFKNSSFSEGTTALPSDWHRVSPDVTMAVRKVGLSCLRKQICISVKNFLQHTPTDATKENPLVTLKVAVNSAVDRSLIRIRENIRGHNDTIQIPYIHRNITSTINKQIAAVDGTFTNLSTIERMGNAVAIIRLHEYNITSTYIIREALIRYGHYSVHSKMGSDKGKMFVSIKDLQIQGNRLLSAKDCSATLQHISVTKIGELKYTLESAGKWYDVFATLGTSNSDLWGDEVKKVIEDILPRTLYNALEYEDNIFGPCMHHNPREVDYNIYTSQAKYELTEMSTRLPDYKGNVSLKHSL